MAMREASEYFHGEPRPGRLGSAVSTEKTFHFEDVDAAATTHSRSPPAAPPLPPQNIITVFAHRPRKISTSSDSQHSIGTGTGDSYSTGTWNSNRSGSGGYTTHRHGTRTSTSASAPRQPSAPAPDYSPSSLESYPLTSLSSSASGGFSSATSGRHRRSPSYAASSSSTSPASPASAPHHHRRHRARAAASTSASASTSSHQQEQQQQPQPKARFKMPFRDRMARRFGETVSAPDSSHPVFSCDPEFNPRRSIIPAVLLDRSLCSHPVSSGASIIYGNDSTNAGCTNHPPSRDPRSGTDRRCKQQPKASARHTRKNTDSGRGDSGVESVAREGLGPQHRGAERITKISKSQLGTKRRGAKTPVATTGSTVGVRDPAQPSSPARVTRTTRSSSRAARPRADDAGDELDDLFGSGRPCGGRITRARSKEVKKTDKDGKQLSPTSPYLSYHDVCLTYEDIKALRHDWLTDNNIAFWEEWLEREILPKYPQARICLLRPSMTHYLMLQDPAALGDALPNLTKVTHIFLPVNDGTSRTQADGSHWSLLLVSKIDGVAFHYDSLGGANNHEGERVTQKLSAYLGMHLKYQSIQDCPQQENGNDCGVFVCILMRHLLVKRLLNANAREKVSMSMNNKMIDATGARKEMIKIIESLRKEGERRRSASPFAKNEGAPRID